MCVGGVDFHRTVLVFCSPIVACVAHPYGLGDSPNDLVQFQVVGWVCRWVDELPRVSSDKIKHFRQGTICGVAFVSNSERGTCAWIRCIGSPCWLAAKLWTSNGLHDTWQAMHTLYARCIVLSRAHTHTLSLSQTLLSLVLCSTRMLLAKLND